jgi:hypothetical protein
LLLVPVMRLLRWVLAARWCQIVVDGPTATGGTAKR